MEEPITLFVYDLSNGMARSFGRALTGTDIDGIWHTSLVLYGMEIFYGQGIDIVSPPGTTHHGTPMKRLPMGTTMLDRDTVREYIEGMREVYTADNHLLDFNCNSFTNDVLGFLNGNSIPAEIISSVPSSRCQGQVLSHLPMDGHLDLPRDILATPFGQQMRPMIDQMFSGRAGPSARSAVNTLLPTTPADVSRSSLSSNLQIVSSVATLSNLISCSPAPLAVMYTSQSCGPCITIKPVFEELARQSPTVRFAIVEMTGPGGQQVASDPEGKFGGPVAATPTFRFWEGGVVVGELKGADKSELEMRVKMLAHAQPPKKLAHLALPQLRKLAASRVPLTYTTKPNPGALSSKLESFLSCAAMTSSTHLADSTAAVLCKQIVPLLDSKVTASSPTPATSPALVTSWATATENALTVLPRPEWFPLLDLYRLALTIPAVAGPVIPTLMPSLLSIVLSTPPSEEESSGDKEGKATLTTLLKLVTNAVAVAALARELLPPAGVHAAATLALVVRALLHSEPSVRRTAAGLAWSAAIVVVDSGDSGSEGNAKESNEEWQVELASAVLEALRNEEDAEVVHRLVGTLGLMLLGSSESAIKDLLTALGAAEILMDKAKVVASKPDISSTVLEVKSIIDS